MKASRWIARTVFAIALVGAVTHGSLHAQDKPAAKPPAGSAIDRDWQPMIDHMKKMVAEMERIQQTTDPMERQKLMAEHMRQMHQGMGMMRGMGGPAMGMMHGGMRGHQRPAGPDHRMQWMEYRMDMMHTMMEHMMQHQRMYPPQPAK
jgi:hypothetical protein